jgi:hypothetical protein
MALCAFAVRFAFQLICVHPRKSAVKGFGLIRVIRGQSVARRLRGQRLAQQTKLLHGPIPEHGFAIDVAAGDGTEVAAVI